MSPADIAWILACFALVTFFFPGISLFYGGMLDGKNVLNMMMMVMSTLAVTTVIYIVYVHGLVVGDSVGGLGLIGNPLEYLGYGGFFEDDGEGGPLWGAFYILFAAVSVALVASGAAGRMRFGSWLVFSALWVTLVYAPMAHWVFTETDEESGYIGGWMRSQLGLHDFAGGTAVHMNAGAAGLAIALVLGARKNTETRPHNLPMTVIAGGMILAGWMGFNGGTAGGANFLAQYVILTSAIAAATGMLGFMLVEKIRDGHPTLLGLVTGMVSGLVGITPSADAVSPLGALFVGFLSAMAAAWAITWKRKHRIDDSLDVFAVHGIAGIVGAMFVVFFGSASAPAQTAGVFLGGDPGLIWREIVAITVTLVYSFTVTYAIAWVMNRIRPIRVSEDDETAGLDRALHAETAYARDTL